jgi:hypothetical protein
MTLFFLFFYPLPSLDIDLFLSLLEEFFVIFFILDAFLAAFFVPDFFILEFRIV